MIVIPSRALVTFTAFNLGCVPRNSSQQISNNSVFLQITGLMAFLLFLLFACVLSAVSTAAHPGEREDVIGQYALANEKQCNRLCWHRQLCTSYSYNSKSPPSSLAPVVYNCILHTNSVDSNRTEQNVSSQAADWAERSISTSPVNDGCKSRPCSRKEVCVPASSNLVSTSSESISHVCLSLPSECGVPKKVSHGQVIASGRIQDDVAYMRCDEVSVESPKNASLEMSCLVTSAWSAMEGECVQYKYETYDGSMMRLPWRLEENSKICIRGTLSPSLFSINLVPEPSEDNILAHLRLGTPGPYYPSTFVWDIKKDGDWKYVGNSTDIPLNPGDSFNVILHVQNNQVELVLNEVTYPVPLDVSQANFMFSDVTDSPMFINLISGC